MSDLELASFVACLLISGFSLGLVVATIIFRNEHRAWMKLQDRMISCLERMERNNR